MQILKTIIKTALTLSLSILWVLTTPCYAERYDENSPTNHNLEKLNTKDNFLLTSQQQRWLELHPTISIAFDGDFPPYSFINEYNQLEGLSVDIWQLIADRIGININIYPQTNWQLLYQAAQNKQVDVVATMVERPERTEWFNFTQNYIQKSLVIIAQSDNNQIMHRDDIRGKTIALVKNYQYVSKILTEFPDVEPLYVDNMLDALNAVSTGEADAAITFFGAGHYYRNKYLLANLKYAAIYDRNNSLESFAIRKDWPELQQIIDKALASISEQQLQALRAKWLPVNDLENITAVQLTKAETDWLKNHNTIRVGVDPEFAPFEFIENGVYSGMASDYIKLLSQRLNIKLEIEPNLTWTQVIDKAKRKEIDILPAVAKTDERESYLNFTLPYIKFHRVVIARDDIPFIGELHDLKNYQVAVQESTSHLGFLLEKTDLTPISYPTLEKSLLAVAGGEADVFIGDLASATYFIRKLNLNNLKVAASVSKDAQSLHLAVRKDWPELISILQKGLDSITTKQQQEISRKWLTVDYIPSVNYRIIWQIIIPLVLIIIAVMSWNITLKKQVKKRTSELMYNANYSQLTHLPNRFLIMDRLKQAINTAQQYHHKVALISVDIDDFKKVNDTFGHNHGDLLLKDVAQRLNNALNHNNSVGHLGGDQFLIIVNTINSVTDISYFYDLVIAAFNEKFIIDNQQLYLSVSLGIAIYPTDGVDAEELLKNADSATHVAKEQVQDSFAFYTKQLNHKLTRQVAIEQEMIGALDRNEFSVHYQPKVCTVSGKVISFEALIRWENSSLGLISPIEFIPIAEKNGYIELIGMFVINDALATLKSWQNTYNQQFTMAINLSPIQLRANDFIEKLTAALNAYNVAKNTLELEITEGVLLDAHANVQKKLTQLSHLGIKLAMDDFGTGYSSMSYLRKYKFDILKIDREFVADLAQEQSNQKLISATVAMAHAFDMQVVAEGVETEEQRNILTKLNCDMLQGWLFSKAKPASDIAILLNEQYTKNHYENV